MLFNRTTGNIFKYCCPAGDEDAKGTAKQGAAQKSWTNPNIVFRRHPVYRGHDWDMLRWINDVEDIAKGDVFFLVLPQFAKGIFGDIDPVIIFRFMRNMMYWWRQDGDG